MLEGTSGSAVVQASIPIQHTYWVSDYYNRLMTLVLRFPVTHLMISTAVRCLRVCHVWFIIHQFNLYLLFLIFSFQSKRADNYHSYSSPYLSMWPFSLRTEHWKVVQSVDFLLLSPSSSHLTICFSPGLVTQTTSPKQASQSHCKSCTLFCLNI